MKTITRNNYEEFFLDYIEGEINAPDKVTLELFLVQNPDLKKELDEMMGVNIKCVGDTISGGRDSLKTIPFQENFDDFCIAKIEGDLNTYENEAFEKYMLSNSYREKEFSLYKKTKLEADQAVIFKDKKNLKRRNKGLIIKQFVYATFAVAASIILLFSIWTDGIENSPTDLKNERVSQNTSMPIATPDSITKKILKEIKSEKSTVNTKKQEKEYKPSKAKVKGKIQNKKIIKTDALPIRAEVTTRGTIEKIVVKQLLADNEVLAIKNINLPDTKIKIIDKTNSSDQKNTGLAMLGLSWKASKGDDQVKEKSTLLKIASYGVNQIGKLAGKKINLEKKYNPKTDKTRVAFNTLGIGFSTPVK